LSPLNTPAYFAPDWEIKQRTGTPERSGG